MHPPPQSWHESSSALFCQRRPTRARSPTCLGYMARYRPRRGSPRVSPPPWEAPRTKRRRAAAEGRARRLTCARRAVAALSSWRALRVWAQGRWSCRATRRSSLGRLA
eukprot:3768372-Prymnesium_polylepis.1